MDLPQTLIATTIKRGVVIYSKHFEKTAIGHGKFFVVMGVSGNIVTGCFFINSCVNTLALRHQVQLEMQFPIEPSEYDFLNHRSYINATYLEKINKDTLIQHLENGVARICGNILKDKMDEILECCRNSELFSKIEKQTYFSLS